MDGEKSSLVVKDVATGFIAVYPSARRTIEEIVRSLQHFVGPNEKVGIFYSDNAPELVAAIKQLQWRHVLDVPYISQTNAVAERAVRSVLEGTRVNLLQAGLHHSYWPHAARHWCHMSNVLSRDGQPSPWKLRFESFPGTLIPFGTKVEFWIGPRLKPKEDLRFEPSTNPGVFMGYALHPGCMWRKEFLCIPLKALMDRPFDEPIKPLRTNQIEKPSEIRFPNRLRYDAIREGASLEDLSNPVEYVGAPEAEGADPPKIIEDKSTADGAELDPHEANISRTAGSVLHEGWLAFLASVNTKVGWYVFAECHVHVAGGRSKAEELFDKADPANVPYRTTLCRAGSGYYVLMANEIVDPPTSDGGVDHGVQELIVTIYSPGEITITQRTEDPIAPGSADELIEVIDPKTAKREFIKRGDASFYSASGYKTRRYKGSSKPMDIPSFVWQAMSVKERRKAIEEEQKGLAAKAKAKARPKATPAVRLGHTGRTIVWTNAQCHNESECPAMPVISDLSHRPKTEARLPIHELFDDVRAAVARPVGQKEIQSDPAAQKSLDVEWEKLEKKRAWMYETVCEWNDVVKRVKSTNSKAHIGRVFEICVEKGSELPKGDPLRKFKGRTVFQGNNVKDENADVALFSELGSAPSTMEAGKVVDSYGSLPGHTAEQCDGVQAYHAGRRDVG